MYNAAGVLLANQGEARNAPSATTRVTANLVTPVFFMEQGGHCRVMAFQDSGGNLDLMTADAYTFEASLEKVG